MYVPLRLCCVVVTLAGLLYSGEAFLSQPLHVPLSIGDGVVMPRILAASGKVIITGVRYFVSILTAKR